MSDLSGTWLGTYWQHGEPTRFEMTLVQGGNRLSGNILDDGALGEAQVVGTLVGQQVQFSKRYLVSHSHPIEYSGTLLPQNDVIQGTWLLAGDPAGQTAGQWEARRGGDALMVDLQERLALTAVGSAGLM